MHLWYQSFFQVKIAAMVTKSRETINSYQYFLIVFSNTQNFLLFFWTWSCMVITQNGRKILWGHHACLGDIMQSIAKMGIFCSFSEESLGWVLQKLAFSLAFKQISIFPINLTKCQINCIIIVKEHWNLSRITILPSCAEELRSAKRENDLNQAEWRSCWPS